MAKAETSPIIVYRVEHRKTTTGTHRAARNNGRSSFPLSDVDINRFDGMATPTNEYFHTIVNLEVQFDSFFFRPSPFKPGMRCAFPNKTALKRFITMTSLRKGAEKGFGVFRYELTDKYAVATDQVIFTPKFARRLDEVTHEFI